jgi:Acyclic terpene utilisation family protein AtuA
MTIQDDQCIRVLVPAGVLGWGVRADEIEAGLAMAPHAIALDAGSTDSGPAYLATGRTKYGRQSIKRDLSLLMAARRRAGVPLLIGSCGTSGCDMAVDQTLEIALEVAREQGDAARIAVVYSEQSAKDLKTRNSAGLVTPLAPAGQLSNASLDACNHIVALLGPEPYMAAVAAGADIVLGGRTTDTAVLAAVPLMRGADVAAAWHAAKIAECGGLCSINPTSPGVMMSIDRHGFSIEPLSPQNRCTPETVSAHMLYENSDPFRLAEPGGVLDVTDARYSAIDARRVRVVGSRWETKPYTMKLEGAGGGPFQTIMLVGIEDPAVLKDVDSFVGRMERELRDRVARTLGADAKTDLSLRPYGWNAVSGRPVGADAAPPREIGLMFVATAPTQAMATEAARVCNPIFFHFPVREGNELPSYAFPFSPAEIERGQVFEFHLNHVVHTTSPFELARTRWIDAAAAPEIAAIA